MSKLEKSQPKRWPPAMELLLTVQNLLWCNTYYVHTSDYVTFRFSFIRIVYCTLCSWPCRHETDHNDIQHSLSGCSSSWHGDFPLRFPLPLKFCLSGLKVSYYNVMNVPPVSNRERGECTVQN